ncbi:MAG: hypothetical protein SF029_26010 [bacterium]|nr:hypothetical protein [bacterium]
MTKKRNQQSALQRRIDMLTQQLMDTQDTLRRAVEEKRQAESEAKFWHEMADRLSFDKRMLERQVENLERELTQRRVAESA